MNGAACALATDAKLANYSRSSRSADCHGTNGRSANNRREAPALDICRYSLRLKNLSNLRTYCTLVDSFPFDGYIQAADRRIAKEDIFELLNYYLNTNLTLCIRFHSRQSRCAVENFLKTAELS